jgi:signal transduction histidine kinase
VLVVAPFILTWRTAGLRGFHRRESSRGLSSCSAVLVALAELSPQRDVPYVVFPVLLWAAVRSGPRGAATAVLVVCSITVWNTAQNNGPFVRDSITDSLLRPQLFIAVSALTSLVPRGGGPAERTLAAQRSLASEASQRALRDEQAALRRVATLGRERSAAEPRVRAGDRGGRQLLAVPGASVMRYDGARTRRSWVGGARTARSASRWAARSTWTVTRVSRRCFVAGARSASDRYQETSGILAETLQRSGYQAAGGGAGLVGGRLWGALGRRPGPTSRCRTGLEQRLCDFAELVAQALANADAREQLAASRARIVEAGDVERRRLERNLHDGAQQRLVALALDLTLIGVTLEKDPPAARKTLTAAQDQLAQGLDELRELARGIHPAVLTERGLGPALHALVNACAGAGRDHRAAGGAAGRPVEAAAYYVAPRRSRTWPSTRARDPRHPQRQPRRRARHSRPFPTMASGAPTPRGAPGCAGWRTASRPSAATSTSTVRRPWHPHPAEIPCP